jgi:hypothetical protein
MKKTLVKYPFLNKDVEIYEQENGHKIVLAHKEGDMVNVSSWVKTGSINETDENKIVIVSVDLLYVRLGKTSYRGVKNEHAQEELQMTISDVLNEINKIGIEAYNKEN